MINQNWKKSKWDSDVGKMFSSFGPLINLRERCTLKKSLVRNDFQEFIEYNDMWMENEEISIASVSKS